jgi:hypothetical protein
MDLPKRFHIKIASKQAFDSALAFLHKKGFRWFHGSSLDSPAIANRVWNNIPSTHQFYISGTTTSTQERVVIVARFPRSDSVDLTDLVLKPISPEQVLVMFLKHHRKFTTYKKFLKIAMGTIIATGTSFQLRHTIRISTLDHLQEPFQQLLDKFDLQNSRVNLQTILKMR